MATRILSTLFFLFFLTACGEVPIAEDLNHSQAREVVATLSRSGISASFERERRGSKSYSVTVRSRDFDRSIRILDDHGLPEEPREAFLDSLSTSSFLPDSREVEALRLDHALAVQLEKLLENLPRVISARAIVRYHFTGDKGKGASLVIRSTGMEEKEIEEVKKVVFSIVPGMKQEGLYISLHTQDQTEVIDSSEPDVPLENFLFGWRVAKDDYTGLAISLLGLGKLLHGTDSSIPADAARASSRHAMFCPYLL